MDKITICGYEFKPLDTLTDTQADKWAEIQATSKVEEAVKAVKALDSEMAEVNAEVTAKRAYVRITEENIRQAETAEDEIKITRALERNTNARIILLKSEITQGKKAEEVLEKKQPHLFTINKANLEFIHHLSGTKKTLESWVKQANNNDYTVAHLLIEKLYTPFFRMRAKKLN